MRFPVQFSKFAAVCNQLNRSALVYPAQAVVPMTRNQRHTITIRQKIIVKFHNHDCFRLEHLLVTVALNRKSVFLDGFCFAQLTRDTPST